MALDGVSQLLRSGISVMDSSSTATLQLYRHGFLPHNFSVGELDVLPQCACDRWICRLPHVEHPELAQTPYYALSFSSMVCVAMPTAAHGLQD
jgi:hypothetical protein